MTGGINKFPFLVISQLVVAEGNNFLPVVEIKSKENSDDPI